MYIKDINQPLLKWPHSHIRDKPSMICGRNFHRSHIIQWRLIYFSLLIRYKSFSHDDSIFYLFSGLWMWKTGLTGGSMEMREGKLSSAEYTHCDKNEVKIEWGSKCIKSKGLWLLLWYPQLFIFTLTLSLCHSLPFIYL